LLTVSDQKSNGQMVLDSATSYTALELLMRSNCLCELLMRN